MTTPDPFAPGYRLTDGNQLNLRIANLIRSSDLCHFRHARWHDVDTAAITDAITNITTASTAGAGVTLPQALLGKVLIVSIIREMT